MKTDPESRRPVFVAAIVIIAGQAWYVSLTSSIAFSPTDAMPYSKWAKLVMGVESLLSFATLAVIVARAVNIAH